MSSVPDFSDGTSYGSDLNALWDAIERMDPEKMENIEIDPALLRETERRALRLEIEKKVRKLARADLVTYGRLRYGLKCPDPHQVLFPHQVQIYKDYMEHDMVWLSAPRGFAKTASTSDAIEWRLGHEPHLKWKFVSSTEKIASRRLRQVAFNMLFDPLFRSVFPEIHVDMNRLNRTTLNLIVPDMLNQRDSSIEAFGYSSSPEGSRADAMWFDDVCTFNNSVIEEKERETIKERISTTWLPLRSRPELIMYWTCTLWHEEDASHDLLRRPGMFKRLTRISDDFTCMQGVRPDPDERLPLPARRWNNMTFEWESWWTEEALKTEYKRDPNGFAVAYWLRPVSQSQTDIRFPSKVFWGDETDPDTIGAVRYGLGPDHPIYRCEYIAMGVDLGFSGRREAAYTALVVGGLLPDRTRVLLDADYGRGWEINEKLAHMAALVDKWRPHKIVVESNVGQKTVAEVMMDRPAFRDAVIESHQTGIAKHVKLKQLSEEFHDNKWIIPVETDSDVRQASSSRHPMMETIRQLIAYPSNEYSDLVLAIMMLREALRAVGALDDAWSESVSMGNPQIYTPGHGGATAPTVNIPNFLR
jgi:hypothetical protein